jgi:hypothetical protein
MRYEKYFAIVTVGTLEALIKSQPVSASAVANTVALAENGKVASGVVPDSTTQFTFNGTDKLLVVGNEKDKSIVLCLDYATMGALIAELQQEKLIDGVSGMFTEKADGKPEDYVVAVCKLGKAVTANDIKALVSAIVAALTGSAPAPAPANPTNSAPAPANPTNPTPGPAYAGMTKKRNF